MNALTKAQRRRRLVEGHGAALCPPLAGPGPSGEAIVTAGGVKTGEVDPGTMMSKRRRGFLRGRDFGSGRLYRGLQPPDCLVHRPGSGEGAARYSRRNGNETLSQHCH